MAATSAMQSLGSPAPDFTLLNTVDDQMVSLDVVASDVATVVMFICNHCPYVVHVNAQLVALAQAYQAKGVSFVAISANDAAQYPVDGPDQMKAYAARLGYTFPYLYDETQEVARAYGAVCTPDVFVYDGDTQLAYRGRLDASTPGNGQPNDGADIRRALDQILVGATVTDEQFPSMGCSIKWK